MNIPQTANDLVNATVLCYGIRENGSETAIMPPTFGVLIELSGSIGVCTVAHSIDSKDTRLEIATGVHPAIAESHGFQSDAELLVSLSPDTVADRALLPEGQDLMIVPLPDYDGPCLKVDPLDDADALLLEQAWILLPDFEPDADDILNKVPSGLCGAISQVDQRQIVLSVRGAEGMSGAPVFVRGSSGYRLIGLYAGTRDYTPLTHPHLRDDAKVVPLWELF